VGGLGIAAYGIEEHCGAGNVPGQLLVPVDGGQDTVERCIEIRVVVDGDGSDEQVALGVECRACGIVAQDQGVSRDDLDQADVLVDGTHSSVVAVALGKV